MKSLVLGIGALITGAVLFLAVAHASSTDNLFGWAWSNNAGWIKMNNCDTAQSCGGNSFGVSMQQTAPGAITGYAWSSNIGWITFNNVGCPPLVTDCTAGAYTDWTTGKITGWARACSVYASGCSGALKDNAFRGDWDGFIALSRVRGASPDWGVKINTTTGALSGYAWGSDVLGWISFDGVKLDQNCPVGQVRDPQTNKCVDIICKDPEVLIGASCGVCPSGTVYNSQTRACDPVGCPVGQVLIGSACGVCPSGTVYNGQTLSCDPASCNPPRHIDSTTGQCVRCGWGRTRCAPLWRGCRPCCDGSPPHGSDAYGHHPCVGW